MNSRIFMMVMGCSLVCGEVSFATVGKKQVIAGPEDTVYGIAYNNGIPTRALITANNLKPPYTLKNGQVLIIPLPNQHIVGERETLHSIAEDYAVNVDVLAQENNLTAPSYVSPGTTLIIPSRDTAPLAAALKPPAEDITTTSLAPLPLVKIAEKEPPLPEEPITIADSSNSKLPDDLAKELAAEKAVPAALTENLADKPKEKKAEKKKEALEEDAPVEDKKPLKKKQKKEPTPTDISFAWPVEGELLNKFSPSAKSDGIDIKVPTGTPVKASAAGTVMYAGSELKGFGNLLLIKHKDGWVTAYAHNAELLVKKGDTVKQGQTIAKSGTREGEDGQAQLHFEIRKVKQPIDPLSKLGS